jgi:hypothetical protein
MLEEFLSKGETIIGFWRAGYGASDANLADCSQLFCTNASSRASPR